MSILSVKAIETADAAEKGVTLFGLFGVSEERAVELMETAAVQNATATLATGINNTLELAETEEEAAFLLLWIGGNLSS